MFFLLPDCFMHTGNYKGISTHHQRISHLPGALSGILSLPGKPGAGGIDAQQAGKVLGLHNGNGLLGKSVDKSEGNQE
jgi:hypothetical protein